MLAGAAVSRQCVPPRLQPLQVERRSVLLEERRRTLEELLCLIVAVTVRQL